LKILEEKKWRTNQLTKSPEPYIVSEKLELCAELYIVPKNNNSLVIPFHKCHVLLETAEIPAFQSSSIKLRPAAGNDLTTLDWLPGSLTIRSTLNEIIVNGSGKISLEAIAEKPLSLNFTKNSETYVSIYLLPAGADRPVVLTKNLTCLTHSVESPVEGVKFFDK
jgi:hypothetical protein